MSQGSVTIRVRPIKVAFLINPANSQDLRRGIELASLLWGGSYFPLIPVYNKTPPHFYQHSRKRLSPDEIISGYLQGFDPDIVVPIGTCSDRNFEIGNRELVQEEDLIGHVKEHLTTNYGIGIIELLTDFFEKELKYKRNDDLHFAIPEVTKEHQNFLGSIFGVIPKDVKDFIITRFSNYPEIKVTQISLDTFTDFFPTKGMFPRHLTMWSLNHNPMSNAILFICDANSALDIIDYWNLRASGYYVFPIPIQLLADEKIKIFSREFIERTYKPYRSNPNIYHDTTIQKSRTVSEQAIKDFCESLAITKSGGKMPPKYLIRMWYPRIWDEWARNNTNENIMFPYSHEEELRISDSDDRLELRSINPRFKIAYSSKPSFANEFRFNFFTSKEPMAEVIPEGARGLSLAIGRFGFNDWRFSKFGPTFLAKGHNNLIFLELPKAESVMIEWFRERGWKVGLSGPGRIALQLIKQLGGSMGTSWIAHRGVIELLSDLEKEAGKSRQAIIGKLKKIIEEDKLFFDSDHFLEGLIDSNALRLGAKIKCPICTRYNWFELDSIRYDLACKFCLSEFQPPIKSPKDIEWTYRAHGPFASSTAQGSFTVLLTLRLLAGHHDRGITPLFSYIAEKNGKLLEADLSCLYKQSTWKNSVTNIIHAECKSFNRFEKRDVERMKDLAQEFEGSFLIFSTLNDELNLSEIKMIRSLAIKGRTKRMRGLPYSEVIIFTGVELFSLSGPTECWEQRQGLYKELTQDYIDYSDLHALADATQQLYLDLPSWSAWVDLNRKKKPTRKI
jgi:hypothetical protein